MASPAPADLINARPHPLPYATVILIGGLAALFIGISGLLLLRWWR